MKQSNSLLEIGVEELPSTEIDFLIQQLIRRLPELLERERISAERFKVFYSARRFGVLIYGLVDRQESYIQEKRGPSCSIAFKNEKPTKALEGFLRSNEASVEDIEVRREGDREYVFLTRNVEGLPASIILNKLYRELIESLEFRRPMRLPATNERFVRPVRWIVAMLNDEVLDLELFGKRAGKHSSGHRFLSGELEVNPFSYFDDLRSAYVIADQDERRDKVEHSLKELESSLKARIPVEQDLLEDVVKLTEYPTAVPGSFDKKYLDLPSEVITVSLKTHQRTFPVYSSEGMSNTFVAFQDGREDRKGNIRLGYEEVINARLEDAHFYYFRDLSEPLENYVEKLKGILFQAGLGTLYDKTQRTREIAGRILEVLEASTEETRKVDRTALLCKADLATRMVQEFPELQGTMGKIYAEDCGEAREVALGIRDHYTDNDSHSVCLSALVVSAADKIDTVAGNFAVGNRPSSSKDPYALKRKVDIILRILSDSGWDIDLRELFEITTGFLDNVSSTSMSDLSEFCENRFRFFLESRGYSYKVSKAVSAWWWNPYRGSEIAAAIVDAMEERVLEDIMVAFERVHNISKDHESVEYDGRLIREDAEKKLLNCFMTIKDRVTDALSRRLFDKALKDVSKLRKPVDDYFDNVFVMDNQIDIRLNRLGFLKAIDELFMQIADFSPLLGNSIADGKTL